MCLAIPSEREVGDHDHLTQHKEWRGLTSKKKNITIKVAQGIDMGLIDEFQ